MRSTALITLALFSSLAIADAPKAETASLKLQVGSISPSVKVDSWVQGKSTNIIRAGQIYVLEFWATWCGPCIKAMPHVSELSKKYQGKVEFIGVNVWEDRGEGYTAPAKVKQFMKDNPGLMSYSVAIDTKDGYMASNWLEAAGADSIPKTVVIGKDQKVAFIGHPLELDLVLPDIVAGKFDAKAFANRPKQPDTKIAEKAITDKNAKILRSEADRIEKGWPTQKQFADCLRFLADHIEDPVGTQQRVKDLINSKEYFPLTISLGLLSTAEWITNAELGHIARWLEEMIETEDPMTFLAYGSLSKLYEKLGDKTKAANTLERFKIFGKKIGMDEKTINEMMQLGQKMQSP